VTRYSRMLHEHNTPLRKWHSTGFGSTCSNYKKNGVVLHTWHSTSLGCTIQQCLLYFTGGTVLALAVQAMSAVLHEWHSTSLDCTIQQCLLYFTRGTVLALVVHTEINCTSRVAQYLRTAKRMYHCTPCVGHSTCRLLYVFGAVLDVTQH
jgi:hypothetical protein